VTDVLVLPGDTALITSEMLVELIETHVSEGNAATILTAVFEETPPYGRIVRAVDGSVIKVQEAKDADKATLAIREVNTSIYCFDRKLLSEKLTMLGNDNAQGEYYLTDVIELLSASGKRVGAVLSKKPEETLGINTMDDLAKTIALMKRRRGVCCG
jgi:bifunctional UDP-N-acetylglucosamine pyrophosphorylase/glucosamine-1-phosphate N-acetyltransferase